MKRSFATAVALLFAGLAALWQTHDASGQPAGWTALFDGKTIDNWEKLGGANWRVEDGLIVADATTKGFSYLVSKDNYTDMEIRAEFWVDAGTNSGIFVHCTDPNKINSQTGYEINIFDDRPDQIYGTGSIRHLAKPLVDVKATGQWNTYEIRLKGPQFFVTFNGTKTIDGFSDAKFPSGRVALQYAFGAVKFRKVDVRPL